MIRVLFFAKVRDQLGVSEVNIDFNKPIEVKELLISLQQRSDVWQRTLAQNSLLVAVNQVMSKLDHVLQDGDEVAFFPPVTGG